jgi:actin-related protein
MLGEQLFGDIDNEETNIAYSLLEVILNIPAEERKKLVQNIVICGGTSMVMGFYRRFVKNHNVVI